MNTSVSRLFAIAVAAGIGMSAAPAFAAKVKITYATYLEPAHLSVFWPIMNGKIKSDTVEVEVKNLSIAATAQAMATKQYDIFEIGALSIEAAEKQGLELQMVGTGLRYSPDTRGFGVWVKADSKYQTMADLKGKKIGSYSFQSTVFALQRIAIKEKYKVNIALNGGDFNFVQLPAPALPAALITGNVDAATLSHLQSYDAMNSKDFRLIVDSGKDFMEVYGVPMVTSIQVAFPERLNKDPESYHEALRMLAASATYARTHQDEVFTAVAAETKVPVDFFKEWHAHYGNVPIAISNDDVKAMDILYKKAKVEGLSEKMPEFSKVIWNKSVRE